MKFDIRKFKKVAADEHKTTLENPQGHQLTIAHSALSPKMREKLGALPGAQKMAGGGMAERPDMNQLPQMKQPEININLGGAQPQQVAQNSPPPMEAPPLTQENKYADIYNKVLGSYSISGRDASVSSSAREQALTAALRAKEQDKVNGAWDAVGKENELAKLQKENEGRMALGMPALPIPEELARSGPPPPPPPPGGNVTNANSTDQPTPQAQPNQYQQMMANPYNTAMQGFGSQFAGLQQAAAAQQQMAKEQSQALAQQVDWQKNFAATTQKNFDDIQKETDAAVADLRAQHINPNHYTENMSSFGKARTAIGLILGGMGAGLTGGENPALKFLNSQIDRDVQSQQANMNNKATLVGAYYKKFGNMKDAMDMARITQLGMYNSMLQQAAAKAGGPMAAAAAKEAGGKLMNQAAEYQMGMAQRMAMMGMMGGGGQGIDPEMLPPEMRERVVQMPSGQMKLAYTKEGATETRKAMADLSEYRNAILEAKKFAQETGTTVPGSVNNARAKTIHTGLVMGGTKLHGLNRLTDVDVDLFSHAIPNPGQMRSAAALAQYDEVLKKIDEVLAGGFKTQLQGYNQNAIPEAPADLSKHQAKK